MRILGIDFGEARIGVAISDPLGITAQALETIHWKGEWKKPLERIRELVVSYSCTTLVVGFPENMNGTLGERGIRTKGLSRSWKGLYRASGSSHGMKGFPPCSPEMYSSKWASTAKGTKRKLISWQHPLFFKAIWMHTAEMIDSAGETHAHKR